MKSTSVTKTAKTSGCGCGCGGGGGASGGGSKVVPAGKASCQCGCGGCSACEAQAAFVRPRFFPGQLLTEDDLGGLVDYVVQKQRLHNRMLFGDGVGCGLEVLCHPCGGGKVVIGAGFALDCCGNDIVVPCPQEVDINRLVRDLVRACGHECGEPAPDAKPGKLPPKKEDIGRAEETGEFSEVSSFRPERVPEETKAVETERVYCLYIRYCETPIEPVAPYTTDDPCAAQACEFSRVQEGFSFELRCAEDDPERPEYSRALAEYMAPLVGNDAAGTLMNTLQERSNGLREALLRIPAGAFSFGSSDGAQALSYVNESPSGESLSDKAARLERYAALVVKHDLARASNHNMAVNGHVTDLRVKVTALSTEVENDASASQQPQIVQSIAAAIVRVARRWTASSNQTSGWELRYEPRLLGAGAALDHGLYNTYRDALFDLKQRLYTAASAGRTDCELLATIAALPLPGPVPAEITEAEAQAVIAAMRAAGAAMRRYLLDAACRAMLVQCPPCDDPAVLLACLTVKDCQVLDICNMRRRFLLTPVAARYWLGSVFDLLGEIAEQVCCGDDDDVSIKLSRQGLKGSNIRTAKLLTGALGQSFSASSKVLGASAAQPTFASFASGLVQGLADRFGIPQTLIGLETDRYAQQKIRLADAINKRNEAIEQHIVRERAEAAVLVAESTEEIREALKREVVKKRKGKPAAEGDDHG
jgi:hypothetical protein